MGAFAACPRDDRHEEEREALRRAHLKLKTVLGSITDGLAVMDGEWRFTYLSATGEDRGGHGGFVPDAHRGWQP